MVKWIHWMIFVIGRTPMAPMTINNSQNVLMQCSDAHRHNEIRCSLVNWWIPWWQKSSDILDKYGIVMDWDLWLESRVHGYLQPNWNIASIVQIQPASKILAPMENTLYCSFTLSQSASAGNVADKSFLLGIVLSSAFHIALRSWYSLVHKRINRTIQIVVRYVLRFHTHTVTVVDAIVDGKMCSFYCIFLPRTMCVFAWHRYSDGNWILPAHTHTRSHIRETAMKSRFGTSDGDKFSFAQVQ